ncbi:MAG: RsmF rRNA methyltransferase first C-terminal domain-containing protein [Caldilineales bacterium]|nr:RsmF rRNA methyltransferase first C-terminal domain-containing protein [Caldilineales bacterium]
MLPERFEIRMRTLLGDEADAFFAALAESPRVGLRVNLLKVRAEDFAGLTGWPFEPVPWCDEGYVIPGADEARPGRHPYHAAGLYYLQDPSAMAAAVLLDPQPGELALDLAAAPGGKATHIASRMRGRGLLVANDVVRNRTAALVENFERSGIANALVMSSQPADLAAQWPGQFDRVLVDAPCSGEGMFRKAEAARQEWNEAHVQGCATRQSAILDDAAVLVRPGGRMVYATCTFAPEENEAVIAAFLRQHPDFALRQPPSFPGFDPGRPDWISPDLARGLPLERCVRIWPHRSVGEGHFFAVLDRQGDQEAPDPDVGRGRLPRDATALFETFWHETLALDLPEYGWQQYGEWLHWLPVDPEWWGTQRPLRAGLRVGKLAKGRFEPHHALALWLQPDKVLQWLDLRSDSAELAAYLRGETLLSSGPDGWTLTTVDGFSLGWGKRVQGVVKNHYPRGLRQHR